MKTRSTTLKEQPSGWVPDCLLWELVRKNHSLMKKTPNLTFSLESHNVLSKHSPKFTGFTHKPSFDVTLNSTGSVLHYKSRRLGNTRRPSSKTSEKRLPKSFKYLQFLKNSVKKQRPDLTKHVLAKFTKLVHSKTDEKQEQ